MNFRKAKTKDLYLRDTLLENIFIMEYMRLVVVLLPLVPVMPMVWSAYSCRKISVCDDMFSAGAMPSKSNVGMPGDFSITSYSPA